MDRRAAERARQDIARAAHRGLDAIELFKHAARALEPVMPIDAWCGLIMDPTTVMSTGGIHEYGFPFRYLPRCMEIEYAEPDVNKFADLGRQRVPAGTLRQATAGAPQGSLHYQEVLRPSSYGDELRVSLRSGATTWGGMVFLRGDGAPDFTSQEAALVVGVAPVLGEGIRRSLLLSANGSVAAGYGVVLLDADGRLEAMNADAERLVSQLVEVGPHDGQLPHSIYGVAARAGQLASEAGSADSEPARARARTSSGAWVTLHGSVLDGGSGLRTAVVIEPSRPPEVAPLLLQAYGLTPRELEVAQLLLAGFSAPHIARLLVLSPHTARDHLKSIFARVGVTSQQELIARVYFGHYLPRMAGGAPPGPNGWFA